MVIAWFGILKMYFPHQNVLNFTPLNLIECHESSPSDFRFTWILMELFLNDAICLYSLI